MARVTGRGGIAGNLKRHCPRWVVYSPVGLLAAANIINIGADVGAMGAALRLVIGGPALVYVFLFGAASILLEVFVRYSRYVSVLKWLTLSLFAYVGVALVVHMPWDKAADHLAAPELSLAPGYLTVVVAILGTTISPYLFLWQAEEEVEDVKGRTDARPLERPSWGALNFVHFIDPIKALFWSAVINGVASVPIMVLIMHLASRTTVMGEFKLHVGLSVMGWIATVVMALAAIGMFVTIGA